MKKHAAEVLALLKKQIGNDQEVADIAKTATKVSQKWIQPLSGGKEETNGLVYGLVQSGKTGVLTVTGAIGADEGYRTIIVLTSDNDPLYDQTFGRIQESFPGMDILGKHDFKDVDAFIERIKVGTCAIVTTKNSKRLEALIHNFQLAKVRGLSCLIIDDEADQASLNTRALQDDGTLSKINERISDLRSFFQKNTYLQVTATPQALFLQRLDHQFRPKFTVLSHPGSDYVGGQDFFSDSSGLVREFNIADIGALAGGTQPQPGLHIPLSLLTALDTFMIGATYKRSIDPEQNCAFLCHVSTRKADHQHIVSLLRAYKSELAAGLKAGSQKVKARLRLAYDDLASTHAGVKAFEFDELIANIGFYSPGITVKLVNGETDEDVAVRSPYNLFVGGNKLGRGVTIKNLLVSYYGRNPRSPQADTVLQHARMYGYRRKDIGLLRLFLPPQLHTVFKAINRMEVGLRDLIENNSSEQFRGIFIESGLSPTRRNVLAPGSVGVYAGGSNYNPAQVLREKDIEPLTKKINAYLAEVADKQSVEMPIDDIISLINLTRPDESRSQFIWNSTAITESIRQFAKLHNRAKAFVYVDRDRGLQEDRRETQGIIEGGEHLKIPTGDLGLFLLRTKTANGMSAAWWPQVRFPNGAYAFAFAI